MTAAYPYSMMSLNDNWFEDRLQPEGASKGCGDINGKTSRRIENDLAYIGERFDVLTRIARVPQKISFAQPDDGFNEKATLNRTDFADPLSRKEFVRNPPAKPAMLNSTTIPEVCYEARRPIPGKKNGFGSVLQRHDANHEQRFWNTTHEDNYGPCPAGARTRTLRRSASDTLMASGVSVLDAAHRAEGMKVGVLTGENYNPVADPSSSTHVQRAWQYQQDPALKNIAMGGKKPPPPAFDNEASIPIGEGQHAKNQAKLDARGGKLYKVATTITKGNGKRYGINIFED